MTVFLRDQREVVTGGWGEDHSVEFPSVCLLAPVVEGSSGRKEVTKILIIFLDSREAVFIFLGKKCVSERSLSESRRG